MKEMNDFTNGNNINTMGYFLLYIYIYILFLLMHLESSLESDQNILVPESKRQCIPGFE